MRQLLVMAGSLGFLALWVIAWGVVATGSLRAGVRYLRIWLIVMGGTLAVAAVAMLLAWPFMPG